MAFIANSSTPPGSSQCIATSDISNFFFIVPLKERYLPGRVFNVVRKLFNDLRKKYERITRLVIAYSKGALDSIFENLFCLV
jgi:hypothetical protein